jgi:RNA polymerase sigma-70 factor (ECF subfamily)
MSEEKQALIQRLWDEHGDRLLAYFFKRIRNPAQAADMAQDVFTRMLAADLDRVQNPEGYLYAVALNLLRENYGRVQRDQSTLDVDDPLVEELLAEQPSYVEQIDGARTAERLHAVLSELSSKCHNVVILHFWYGLKYDDIAEKMNISRDQVKKYVSQALALGRRRMKRLG